MIRIRAGARQVALAGVAALLACAVSYGALQLTLGNAPAAIHVRWAPGLTDGDRAAAEQRYGLSQGTPLESRTWSYTLRDTSAANVERLVGDAVVEDTSEIDRSTFQVAPESTRNRPRPSNRPLLSAALRITTILLLALGLALLGLGSIQATAPGVMGGVGAGVGTGVVAGVERRLNGNDVPLGSAQRALLFLLLAVLFTLDVASMQRLTLTADEPEHLEYGQHILALDATRFDDSKMPISALNALPGLVAAHLPDPAVRSSLQRPETGRYATVIFSLVTAVVIFIWARMLYGANAGLLALTLYTFDPNILAHSQLITTDIYAAGTVLFALYAFWLFLHSGGARLAVASGLLIGIALLSKYTAAVLLPLCALVAALFHARTLLEEIHRRRWDVLRRRTARFAGYAVLIGAVILVVLNIGFLFNRTLTPVSQYAFRSDRLRTWQVTLGRAGELPLPIPYPYLEGLDAVTAHEREGSSFGRLYLLGELREDRAFPGYYFYAFLYKVPLATQFLLLAAGLAYVASVRRFDVLRNEAALAVPVLFFTIYFNFFYRAQIGIRYFLINMPLLYVLCGSLLAHGRRLPRRAVFALAGAIVSLVVSVLSYYPHFLPYFNELVWDRTRAYTVLADSNIDWGQDGWYVAQYGAAHPEVIINPDQPTAGTLLVHVNDLTGVTGDPEKFRWLREHFTPAGQVAYAALVYRVSGADLERLRAPR